jgi:hypothetical protein
MPVGSEATSLQDALTEQSLVAYVRVLFQLLIYKKENCSTTALVPPRRPRRATVSPSADHLVSMWEMLNSQGATDGPVRGLQDGLRSGPRAGRQHHCGGAPRPRHRRSDPRERIRECAVLREFLMLSRIYQNSVSNLRIPRKALPLIIISTPSSIP